MKKYLTILALLLGISNYIHAQTPLGSEFTYQGELKDANSNPYNDTFDFNFKLYDAASSGSQIGSDVLVENVEVIDGIFTTQIDFGSSSFIGDKVWLEINIREATSTGGFQQLLPLQQITATPYATHASFVAADAVSGVEILNESITSADIASNAVGASEIIPTQVQRRITDACAAGQFVRSINEDGTVVCGADNSGLTSVTSADIVDGTIATIDLADNSITSAKIDSSQVQERVSGVCADGQYLNGINQDGSVICKKLPVGLAYTLDSIGAVGTHTSIAIGADGNPIISYYDATNDDLKAFKCSNSSCSAGNAYTLDSAGNVGSHTSITLGADDLPIISYYDATNADLKAYKCSNSSCSGGNAYTLDSGGNVGTYTSITIGADDLPIISYYDATNDDLRAYKCSNSSCSGGNAYTLDSAGNVGANTSIAIGADDLPIISYNDATNADLKAYKCSNSSCSAGNAYTLDSAGDVGWHTSIAIGADDLPIISYLDYTNDDLKAYKCSNSSCSGGNAYTLDSSGSYTSIVIGADDLPIISYFDGSNADLKAYKCSNSSCSGGNAYTLDSIGIVGWDTSIAIGADDLPIISYRDATNDDLKVYSCGNINCSN